MRNIVINAILCVAALFTIPALGAPEANADSYDEMHAAVAFLANKYGVIAYTAHQPMEYGIYARAYGDTIVFNTGYVNNPDQLRADMTADVISGYHVGLHCSPEQALAAHEFAHVLDYLTGYTARDELNYALANGLTGEVSGYSLTSDGEALAEAFTAVECDVPNDVEMTLYRMLTT